MSSILDVNNYQGLIKIIEYRNSNGLFEKIENILNVSGISESIFNKIKDNIEV